MSFKRVFVIGFAVAAMTAVSGTAWADWIVTPFVGWNFGGSADVSGCIGDQCGVSASDKFEHKIDYGVSLATMGAGIAGFELDLGYSPNFFATNTASNNTFRFTNTSNAVTVMGNLILGAPVGGHGASIRPYAVGGVGLIRTNVQDFEQTFSVNTKNDFGFDLGAGVMGFFTDAIGLRGDVRYFRSFTGSSSNVTGLGLSSFRYWRGSVGVSFKF